MAAPGKEIVRWVDVIFVPRDCDGRGEETEGREVSGALGAEGGFARVGGEGGEGFLGGCGGGEEECVGCYVGGRRGGQLSGRELGIRSSDSRRKGSGGGAE